MCTMARTWLVTGAARGIGAEVVKAALEAGDNVVATARDPKKIESAFDGGSGRLLAVELDVTDPGQIDAAVDAAIEQFGGIDVLVNNAGYGLLGMFEESTPEEIRAEFETNVFGLMAVTRAVVPGMRERRKGRVFNISSVAGLRGVSGGSIYAASKFAVEGFSQGIAEELAPFGVYVTSVSPGYVRTDFLDPSSVKFSGKGIGDYARARADLRAFYENRNHNQAGDPARLADAILRLADLEKPPVSFVAGSDGVAWAKGAIESRQAQLEEWRDLSASTDGHW
jgi:NAD(P)-dependent dehydrogenase (short-subunit alcohol dehydrogenase family)